MVDGVESVKLPQFKINGSNLNGYNNLVKQVDPSKTTKKEFGIDYNVFALGMMSHIPCVTSQTKFYDKDENLLFEKTAYHIGNPLAGGFLNKDFVEYSYLGENGNMTVIRDDHSDDQMEEMRQIDKNSGVLTRWIDKDQNGTFDERISNDGSKKVYLGRQLLHPSTWFNPKTE